MESSNTNKVLRRKRQLSPIARQKKKIEENNFIYEDLSEVLNEKSLTTRPKIEQIINIKSFQSMFNEIKNELNNTNSNITYSNKDNNFIKLIEKCNNLPSILNIAFDDKKKRESKQFIDIQNKLITITNQQQEYESDKTYKDIILACDSIINTIDFDVQENYKSKSSILTSDAAQVITNIVIRLRQEYDIMYLEYKIKNLNIPLEANFEKKVEKEIKYNKIFKKLETEKDPLNQAKLIKKFYDTQMQNLDDINKELQIQKENYNTERKKVNDFSNNINGITESIIFPNIKELELQIKDIQIKLNEEVNGYNEELNRYQDYTGKYLTQEERKNKINTFIIKSNNFEELKIQKAKKTKYLTDLIQEKSQLEELLENFNLNSSERIQKVLSSYINDIFEDLNKRLELMKLEKNKLRRVNGLTVGSTANIREGNLFDDNFKLIEDIKTLIDNVVFQIEEVKKIQAKMNIYIQKINKKISLELVDNNLLKVEGDYFFLQNKDKKRNIDNIKPSSKRDVSEIIQEKNKIFKEDREKIIKIIKDHSVFKTDFSNLHQESALSEQKDCFNLSFAMPSKKNTNIKFNIKRPFIDKNDKRDLQKIFIKQQEVNESIVDQDCLLLYKYFKNEKEYDATKNHSVYKFEITKKDLEEVFDIQEEEYKEIEMEIIQNTMQKIVNSIKDALSGAKFNEIIKENSQIEILENRQSKAIDIKRDDIVLKIESVNFYKQNRYKEPAELLKGIQNNFFTDIIKIYEEDKFFNRIGNQENNDRFIIINYGKLQELNSKGLIKVDNFLKDILGQHNFNIYANNRNALYNNKLASIHPMTENNYSINR